MGESSDSDPDTPADTPITIIVCVLHGAWKGHVDLLVRQDRPATAPSGPKSPICAAAPGATRDGARVAGFRCGGRPCAPPDQDRGSGLLQDRVKVHTGGRRTSAVQPSSELVLYTGVSRAALRQASHT